jgi:hypothetical protein
MEPSNPQPPEPPKPPEQPPALLARAAQLLTQFTERQTPAAQTTIARALGVVNAWLSRLQKK